MKRENISPPEIKVARLRFILFQMIGGVHHLSCWKTTRNLYVGLAVLREAPVNTLLDPHRELRPRRHNVATRR